MTTLKSNNNIIVEQCCDGADVIRTIKEWGVQWADGVRRWNQGETIKCECSKCNKELKFSVSKGDADNKEVER